MTQMQRATQRSLYCRFRFRAPGAAGIELISGRVPRALRIPRLRRAEMWLRCSSGERREGSSLGNRVGWTVASYLEDRSKVSKRDSLRSRNEYREVSTSLETNVRSHLSKLLVLRCRTVRWYNKISIEPYTRPSLQRDREEQPRRKGEARVPREKG